MPWMVKHLKMKSSTISMGENIHAKYNRLEKKHQNQKNRGKHFFLVIRDLVDENRCDRKHLKKKNNVRRRLV